MRGSCMDGEKTLENDQALQDHQPKQLKATPSDSSDLENQIVDEENGANAADTEALLKNDGISTRTATSAQMSKKITPSGPFPTVKKPPPSDDYEVGFTLAPEAGDLLGKTVEECVLSKMKGVTCVSVNGQTALTYDAKLKVGDILTVKCAAAAVVEDIIHYRPKC